MNLEKLKFNMAYELHRVNFQCFYSDLPERALSNTVGGKWVGKNTSLVDVVTNDMQYSVKSYSAKILKKVITEGKELPTHTPLIVERRVTGISDLSAEPEVVMQEVFNEVEQHERKLRNDNHVDNTNVLLVGYTEDDSHYYFRMTMVPFQHNPCEEYDRVMYKPENVNYETFTDPTHSFVGRVGGKVDSQWIHPNSATFTRCLKRRYDLGNNIFDTVFTVKKMPRAQIPVNDIVQSLVDVPPTKHVGDENV